MHLYILRCGVELTLKSEGCFGLMFILKLNLNCLYLVKFPENLVMFLGNNRKGMDKRVTIEKERTKDEWKASIFSWIKRT